MGKIACVAVVRNEARDIAEWLAWQFCVGFDAVALLDNGSTDATIRIARAMAGEHNIRIFDWPMTAPDYQMRGYEHAARVLAGEFEWLAFFDADEFLVLPDGQDLGAALARCGAAAAVGIPWAIFGSSGHRDIPPGLIIENFLYRSTPAFSPDRHPNRHIKSIIRPGQMRAALNPHAFAMDGPYHGLDGHALALAAPGILLQDPDYAAGKLHHYFVKSWAHWQEKMRRGYRDIVRPEVEFFVYDQNEVFDDSAARKAPALRTRLAGGAPKPETCAVVLVVRDEAYDIAAWLAWYHALGFDACIVYDDESTDGTWDILEHAAQLQDIRLSRTIGDRAGRYEPRQEACYRQAIAQYRGQFDWLAFFDADEFLLLNEDATIQQFLARFAGADAVAVNWCCYGSSGHVLKPQQPVFEAFTWHGDERQPINRHIKSIIRPEKTGPRWENVHCFDIPAQRYRLSNGAPLAWSATPGIIDSEPDWHTAKLMHYQCRSMEHFVERMKKRPELAAMSGIWYGQDVRQVQSFVPPARMAAVLAHLARLRPPARAASGGCVADLVFDIGMSDGNDTAFYRAKGFRVIGVEPDVRMFESLSERFSSDIESGAVKIYNCAASGSAGEILEFFRHDQHQGLSSLSRARPEFADGTYSTYPVLTIDWTALTEKHGVPHYAKIDIEGHECALLSGMADASTLPDFISVECYNFKAAEMLHDLGYRSFQLIDQNPPGGFTLPAVQQEGVSIAWRDWTHSSGPFGRDLNGAWMDFEAFRRLWLTIRPDQSNTWYDCHARLAPP